MSTNASAPNVNGVDNGVANEVAAPNVNSDVGLYYDYSYVAENNDLLDLLGGALSCDSDDECYQPSEGDGYGSEDSALDIVFEDSEDEVGESDKFPIENVILQLAGTTEFEDADEEYQSEELETDLESDSDTQVPRMKYPKFVMPHRMDDYDWIVGTIFSDKAHFKWAADTYTIHSGRNMRWSHSDTRRAIKRCKAVGCKFYISATRLEKRGTWQLKGVGPKHICSRMYNTCNPKREWLAKKFKNRVRRNPGFKVREMILTMSEKYNCGFSISTAQQARKLAKLMTEGDYAKNYLRVYDYAAEIERSNPDSRTVIKTKWPDGWVENRILPDPQRLIFPNFRRFYICLKAARDSFVSSCRPIISLDGCFLKTKYKGQLLTAVGRDANDQMLPIAFAVVESENKDSWCWFLTLLQNDIGCYKEHNWTFISDQQKGLVPAFDDVMAGVDHRYCVRHLYNNFRKRFAEAVFKNLMWRAATATYDQEFDRAMDEIKMHKQEAYDYLLRLDKKYWSKCAFSSHPKCDAVLNNMSETFNSCILSQRELPMTTMLEEIHSYMMSRWQANRTKILKYELDICPRIRSKLDKLTKESGKWIPTSADQDLFHVKHNTEKFVVNLGNWTCDCRRWQVSGIPCCHAIACMRYFQKPIDQYIHTCFKKAAYEACYSHVIKPSNGPQLWPRTNTTDVLPPFIPESTTGKLKMKRRREAEEVSKGKGKGRKLSQHGKKMTCAICHVTGHNRKTCKVVPDVPPPPTRSKRSRPTTEVQLTQPPQSTESLA